MGYTAYSSRYLENDVASRSKEWLVPFLYEHLIAQFRQARIQIQRRDSAGAVETLEKAAAIVTELMGSLQREEGDELTQRLAAVYVFFGAEILAIGRTLDAERLTRVMEMASSLHESWVIAARTRWPTK